jgi:hypothetical protein
VKKLILCLLLTASALAQSVGFYTQSAKTTHVKATASAAYSTATTSVPLVYPERSTNYAASCSLIDAFGLPAVVSLHKFTDHISVTISNGGFGVVSGAAEIDCIVTGSVPTEGVK